MKKNPGESGVSFAINFALFIFSGEKENEEIFFPKSFTMDLPVTNLFLH